MKKIFSFLTKDVFNSLGDVLDNLFTTDEERLNARNEIMKVLLQQANESDKLRSDIIKSETVGNWMQRSWRPILMLSFGFVIVYNKFIAPAFGLPNAELESEFWNLLNIGIGGYIVGRSAEEITKTIKNKK